MEHGLESLRLAQFKNGSWREIDDLLTPEEPVTLNWPQRPGLRLWAYPEDLDNLVLGHCLLELCQPGQGARIIRREEREFWLEPIPAPTPPTARSPRLAAPEILSAMAAFMALPGRWNETGCFHRAALYEPLSRKFVCQAEDVGRHNCLDRLSGQLAGQGSNPLGLVLFVTARATASLVSKAAKAGYGLMVSRSAVTTAGLEISKCCGMSLLGFAREIRFSVFCDPQARIVR